MSEQMKSGFGWLLATPEQHEMRSADRIRELNDDLRHSFNGGKVVLTCGVATLRPATQQKLFLAVHAFDEFSPANDPYCEHDFGEVTCDGERYFWKIDAYDLTLSQLSKDPSDPASTVRVLTIMRADEY